MKLLRKLLLAVCLTGALVAVSCKKEQAVKPASVQITPATVSLTEGETATLSAKVLPDKAQYDGIMWKTSDAGIATVTNDGKVTAVKAGTATITATAGGVSGTATVTVTAKVVKPTSVTVSPSSLPLTEGEVFSFSAKVQPENAEFDGIVWTTSDADVASVSQEGTVTAVKAGTATITAIAGDVSGSATVTVTAKEILVTDVELDQTELELNIGDQAELHAIVFPEDAMDKRVAWSTSDASVAVVNDEGVVEAVGAGEANITVTTLDGGFTDICKVTVIKQAIHVTGISIENWSLTVARGSTAQIIYTITPENADNKDVTFDSSDKAVATVDAGGKVKGVSAGTARITVTTVDGGFTAACVVTVKEPVATFEADGIFYKLINGLNVCVDAHPSKYSGNISVPGEVVYDGITYKVTQVGVMAFMECPDLVSVTLGEGIKEIEAWAFFNDPNLELLSLPSTFLYLKYSNRVLAFCPKLEITVSPENRYWFVDNHALYMKETAGTVLRWMPEKMTGTFTVLDGTYLIAEESVFQTSVDRFIIPQSVSKISVYFFCGECKTPLEIVLNWTTAEEVNNIQTRESHPESFFFNDMDRSQITVSVPKGTKSFYETHWLWGACGSIVERDE